MTEKQKSASSANVKNVGIKDIWDDDCTRDPGWEKEINSLAGLIKNQGLLQPIGVREKKGPGGEKYKVLFGRRRIEACKKLKHTSISARIAPKKITIKDEFLWMMSENGGRQDLKPMEEARAFRKALDSKLFTAKALAQSLDCSDAYISQRLQLMELAGPVKESLAAGKITMTHARELSRVTDEKKQEKLLAKAETMPSFAFKEAVDKLEDGSKKNSNRGRKAKPGSMPNMGGYQVRPENEVTSQLGIIDVRLSKAKASSDSVTVAHLQGMARGIGWVTKKLDALFLKKK